MQALSINELDGMTFYVTEVNGTTDGPQVSRTRLVSRSLKSLFTAQTKLYQRRKVTGGELCLPSTGRPAIY